MSGFTQQHFLSSLLFNFVDFLMPITNWQNLSESRYLKKHCNQLSTLIDGT